MDGQLRMFVMKQVRESWYKLIALVLVLALVVTMLAACGGNEKATPTTNPTTTIPTQTFVPTITPEVTSTPTSTASPTVTPTPVKAPIITVDGVKSKLDSGQNIMLVDVRYQAVFNASHIGQAISIPFDELLNHLTEIPQDVEVIIYAECA